VAETLEFQEQVQEALVVRPGDKLLVRVAPSVDPDVAAAVGRQLRERFSGVEVTVVAAEQFAVVRGD
jgi:hypothetical protein